MYSSSSLSSVDASSSSSSSSSSLPLDNTPTVGMKVNNSSKPLTKGTMLNSKLAGYDGYYASKNDHSSYGLSTPPSSSFSSSSSSSSHGGLGRREGFDDNAGSPTVSFSTIPTDNFQSINTIVTPIIKKGINNPSLDYDYTGTISTPSYTPSSNSSVVIGSTLNGSGSGILTCVPGGLRSTTLLPTELSSSSSSYASVTLSNTYHNTYHTRSHNPSVVLSKHSTNPPPPPPPRHHHRQDPIVRFDTPISPEEMEAAKIADEKKRQNRLQNRQKRKANKVRTTDEQSIPKEVSSSSSLLITYPSSSSSSSELIGTFTTTYDTIIDNTIPRNNPSTTMDTMNNQGFLINDDDGGITNQETVTNDPPSTNRSQDSYSDDRAGDSFDRYFGNTAVQQLVKDIQSGDLHERTKAAKYNSTIINTIKNSSLGVNSYSNNNTTNSNNSSRGNLFRSNTLIHQLPTTEIKTITTTSTTNPYSSGGLNLNMVPSSLSSSASSTLYNDTSDSLPYIPHQTGLFHSPNRQSSPSVSSSSPNLTRTHLHGDNNQLLSIIPSPNRSALHNNHNSNSSFVTNTNQSSQRLASSIYNNNNNQNIPPSSPSLVSPNPRTYAIHHTTANSSNNNNNNMITTLPSTALSASSLLTSTAMNTPASDRARRLVAMGVSTSSATAIPVINMLATRNSVNSKLLQHGMKSSFSASAIKTNIPVVPTSTVPSSHVSSGITVSMNSSSFSPMVPSSPSTITTTIAIPTVLSTPNVSHPVTMNNSSTESVPEENVDSEDKLHTKSDEPKPSVAIVAVEETDNVAVEETDNVAVEETDNVASTAATTPSTAVRKLSYSDDAIDEPLCTAPEITTTTETAVDELIMEPLSKETTFQEPPKESSGSPPTITEIFEFPVADKSANETPLTVEAEPSTRTQCKRKAEDNEDPEMSIDGLSPNTASSRSSSPSISISETKKFRTAADAESTPINSSSEILFGTASISPSSASSMEMTKSTTPSKVSATPTTTTTTTTIPTSSLLLLASPRHYTDNTISLPTVNIKNPAESTPSESNLTSFLNSMGQFSSFSYVSPPSTTMIHQDTLTKKKQPPVKPTARKILSKIVDTSDDEMDSFSSSTRKYDQIPFSYGTESTRSTVTGISSSSTATKSSNSTTLSSSGGSSLSNLLSRGLSVPSLSYPDTRRILFNSSTNTQDGVIQSATKNHVSSSPLPHIPTHNSASLLTLVSSSTNEANRIVPDEEPEEQGIKSTKDKNENTSVRNKPTSTLPQLPTIVGSSSSSRLSSNTPSVISPSLSQIMNVSSSSPSSSSSSSSSSFIPSTTTVRPTRQARDPEKQAAFRNQYALLGTRPNKLTNTVLTSTLNTLYTKNGQESTDQHDNNKKKKKKNAPTNPTTMSFEELLLTKVSNK